MTQRINSQNTNGHNKEVKRCHELRKTFLKRFYLFLFLERGEGWKKGREISVVASRVPPTGDVARNPGMCPDWESNWRPFGSQASAQSTEPHRPGLKKKKILNQGISP